MKILFKIPSTQREERAISLIKSCMDKQTTDNVTYLLSLDVGEDYDIDHKNVMKVFGRTKNKVHAFNRDIEYFDFWDILVAASDDFICQKKGWDEDIIKKFERYFPDTNGVIWFNDGYCEKKFITLPIIGRKYYDEFEYVFHPDYNTSKCDIELRDVSKDRQKYFKTIPFKHMHPGVVGEDVVKRDELYKRNDSQIHKDRPTFKKRRKAGYPKHSVL